MPRPCSHSTGPPKPSVCRVCWLYVHDQRYRRLYDCGEETLPEKVQSRCRFQGEVVEWSICGCESKHVRLCDLHDRCTGRSLGVLRGCDSCPDRLPIGPGAITRVEIPNRTHAFNCSLVEFDKKLLLVYRAERYNAKIVVAELDRTSLQTLREQEVAMDHVFCRAGCDDPAAVVHEGRLHLMFCGLEFRGDRLYGHQMVARLDHRSDRWTVGRVWCPEMKDRQWPMEKNWMPFSRDGKLLAVYSISPHKVVRVDDDLTEVIAVTEQKLRWTGGMLRGGAPPVLVGDEYYHFFHGSLDLEPGKRLYSMGCCVFDASPPFLIKRMTPEPIMIPDETLRQTDQDSSVVFPRGAVLSGDRWLISYGLHDAWCEVAEFDRDSVESWMEVVPDPLY